MFSCSTVCFVKIRFAASTPREVTASIAAAVPTQKPFPVGTCSCRPVFLPAQATVRTVYFIIHFLWKYQIPASKSVSFLFAISFHTFCPYDNIFTLIFLLQNSFSPVQAAFLQYAHSTPEALQSPGIKPLHIVKNQ